MNFDKLEEVFNVAEKITSQDVTVFEDKKLEKIIEAAPAELNEDELTFKMMYENYINALNNFNEIQTISKSLMKAMSSRVAIDIDSIDPDFISSFSSLQKNMISALKVLTESFKNIIDAKHKLDGRMSDDGQSVGSVTNTQNNIIIGESSKKLLEKFGLIED